jgi:peptide deformylase
MILEILTNQNPTLRKISKPIIKITKDIKVLASNMIYTMHSAPGIGLAAPQVGHLVRLIVVDIGDEQGPYIVINPKLTQKKGTQSFVEGCLSVPGIEAPVERASSVLVKGLDIKGKPFELRAEGLLATVFQHETDHLDGKLFVDRVADPNLITYKPKVPREETL